MKILFLFVCLIVVVCSGRSNKNEARQVKENGIPGRKESLAEPNKKQTNKGRETKKSKTKKKKAAKVTKKNRNKKNSKKNWKLNKVNIIKKARQTNKRKKAKKARQVPQERQCPTATPVNSSCLEDAQKALLFETLQVANYLKQKSLLTNHDKIAGNKLGKADEFLDAAEHLVWAAGGNMSSAQCGDKANTSKSANETKTAELAFLLSNYTGLMNCSTRILEMCTMPNSTYNSTIAEKMAACDLVMNQFINGSKACYLLQLDSTSNSTLICGCWGRAAQDVDTMKALKCAAKEIQKAVTAQKNACKKVFSDCKQMEDHSVHLSQHCMHDHSMHLLNQTGKSLHDSVKENLKSNAAKFVISKSNFNP